MTGSFDMETAANQIIMYSRYHRINESRTLTVTVGGQHHTLTISGCRTVSRNKPRDAVVTLDGTQVFTFHPLGNEQQIVRNLMTTILAAVLDAQPVEDLSEPEPDDWEQKETLI